MFRRIFGVAAGLVTFVSVVSAQQCYPDTNSGIKPLLHSSVDSHDPSNFIPNKHVSFTYAQTRESPSGVNLTVDMIHPTILLESIASVATVDCSNTSVAVKFNNMDNFSAAMAAWPPGGNFTLITNHLGDCDAELERGFFRVHDITWCPSTLTATANSEKQDIHSTAENVQMEFGALSAPAVVRRDVDLKKTFNLALNHSFPGNTTLFSKADLITVSADSAEFGTSITFSGRLKYSFLKVKIEEMWFDMDASFNASIGLRAVVLERAYTDFQYAPVSLTIPFLHIPGIIQFGPSLVFGVGAEISSPKALTASAKYSIELTKGNVHVDVLNSSASGTSGWAPVFDVIANVSGPGKVEFNPSASIAVELTVKILAGLVNLSSGITAKPSFKNSLTLNDIDIDLETKRDTINDSAFLHDRGFIDSRSTNTTGNCSHGLAVESEFGFGVDLYVSDYYNTTLFDYKKQIADKCYTWHS